jgi:hypothetical protein
MNAPKTATAYAATVRLLFPVSVQSQAQASDAVSELLTGHAMDNGVLLDWSYLPDGKSGYHYAEAVQIPVPYTPHDDAVPMVRLDPDKFGDPIEDFDDGDLDSNGNPVGFRDPVEGDDGTSLLPGHGKTLFVGLFVTSQHYDGDDYLEPTAALPANLHSVRARTSEGPAYVLTDHGTRADAESAATLLSALTGLKVEA